MSKLCLWRNISVKAACFFFYKRKWHINIMLITSSCHRHTCDGNKNLASARVMHHAFSAKPLVFQFALKFIVVFKGQSSVLPPWYLLPALTPASHCCRICKSGCTAGFLFSADLSCITTQHIAQAPAFTLLLRPTKAALLAYLHRQSWMKMLFACTENKMGDKTQPCGPAGPLSL